MSSQDRTHLSTQETANLSWDNLLDLIQVIPIEFDGITGKRKQTSLAAVKVTTSGTTTYVGKAPIGTAQATAGWQCKKIAVSGASTTITWADSDANFDNVATDLTALTYG